MEMAGSKTTSLRLNATSAKGRMLSMWFRKSKQRMIWKLSQIISPVRRMRFLGCGL